MEFLANYGLFLAKVLTGLVAVLVGVAGIIALMARARSPSPPSGQLDVQSLNERLEEHRDVLRSVVMDEKALKKLEKDERKEESKRPKGERRRVFVLDFDGDVEASAVEPLREEISALLTMATPHDEVVLRLESGGGLVHSYGLAAAQLERIKQHGLRLTVCVDSVAASGGYLMACVADKILAAPFALVGSIGVIGQIPNFHRLLKKHDVDVEVHTAGEYKRTLTMFGPNSDAARDKFREELQETHELFKAVVARFRPDLDVAKVSTGEVWYGQQAVALGLVDELGTSDGYLQDHLAESDIYTVRYVQKPGLRERLGLAMQAGIERAIKRAIVEMDARLLR